MDESTREQILTAMRNEITEYNIYRRLAGTVEAPNSEVLERIGEDELRHYSFWKQHAGEDVEPDRVRIWFYYLMARVLGLTFGVRLMEKGEERAQVSYRELAERIPGAAEIADEEEEHEKQLIGMIDEERLKYVGSIVLGLNDALVELTGALAGFTLALQEARLVAVTGLITGIAASLSMAASEYLSTKAEPGDGKDPVKASVYTGGAYVLTVFFLIVPYLLIPNIYAALAFTLLNAILVILVFTFYISVARDLAFGPRFLEMSGISLGVAAVTFAIGYAIRIVWGLDV